MADQDRISVVVVEMTEVKMIVAQMNLERNVIYASQKNIYRIPVRKMKIVVKIGQSALFANRLSIWLIIVQTRTKNKFIIH